MLNLSNLNNLSGLGTAGSTAFSPSQISGLQFWVSSDQRVYSDAGTTLATNGQTVQQWNDLSGNSRNVSQGTAGARPTYNTAVLNGKPVITFDGVDDVMQASFTLNQPEHVFLVFRQVTWTNGDSIIDGVNALGMCYRQLTTTPRIELEAGGNGPATTSLAVNTFGIIDGLFNGASSAIRLNNGSKTTGNVGALNAGGVTIGAAGNLTIPANIGVAEMLVYNSGLSDGNATLVNRYLGSKYNITVA